MHINEDQIKITSGVACEVREWHDIQRWLTGYEKLNELKLIIILQVAPDVRGHEIYISKGLSSHDMCKYIFAHKHYFMMMLSAIAFMNECTLQFDSFHIDDVRFNTKTGLPLKSKTIMTDLYFRFIFYAYPERLLYDGCQDATPAVSVLLHINPTPEDHLAAIAHHLSAGCSVLYTCF